MPVLSLDDLTRQVLQLPALPQTAAAIIEVSSSSKASARDLKQVISTDQALVTKVLRVVNSPLYALRQRVTTLTHAIAMLGFDAVKNLALAASMSKLLGAPADGYGLKPGRLWLHSIAVGCAAKSIVEIVQRDRAEEAFVAGVIHDVGKLALHVYVRGCYNEIMERVEKEGLPFDEVEREVIGFSHAQAGEAVATAWRLPDVLTEPMRWHHQPGLAADPFMPSVVHLADVVALSLGYGVGSEGLTYRFHDSALVALKLTYSVMDQIAVALPAQVARMTESIEG